MGHRRAAAGGKRPDLTRRTAPWCGARWRAARGGARPAATSRPGGRLLVVDEGDGPPVVLLHAGIVDLRAWDALVPHLVGDSRGGQIAFDTAIEFPDRVVAVVWVGAGLGGFEGHPTPQEIALFEEMERLEEAEPKDPEAIIPFHTRLWVDDPGRAGGRAPAWIAEQVRETGLLLSEPGHVFGRPIVLDPPAADRLADLRCPILAVAGALDVSDVAETAQRLEANAPNARAVLLTHVVHMVAMERPAELAGLVIAFLAPLRPWA